MRDVAPRGDCAFPLKPAGSFGDRVRIELTTRLLEGPLTGSLGFLFSWVGGDTPASYYRFTVSGDGRFTLSRWERDSRPSTGRCRWWSSISVSTR